MNELGVHALVWVGGWSEAEAEQAIRSSAELGYDFVEIPLLDPFSTDVATTKRLLKEHDLGATASLGLTFETDISSEDEAAVRRGEELLNKALDVVVELEGRYLSGVIHSALAKYPGPGTEKGRDNAATVLRRLADRAADHGVTLSLEAVNRYESNVINTADQAVAMIERIGRPNVKAHLDAYHMNIEDGYVADAIVRCGEHLGYFHVGESHRGYLGTGTIDFTAIFRALAKIDFQGPIAFESFSSAVVDPKLSNTLCVWRNLWNDGFDLARHAKSYMDDQLLSARRAVGEKR